ncbi:MAG: flagellar basal body P-ring protein FlgI [Phycisphaeraceae bacterium]|nr:MAG: flagellar basal body P-ring protein FlgI [Phycisphaeraceae bacterium]
MAGRITAPARTRSWVAAAVVSVWGLGWGMGWGVGCESDPRPTRRAEPIVRDVPAVLSNTIGASASLNGTEPVLVFGYGLVVGLNGTGGGTLDESLASQMEREMALRGIDASTDYQGWAIHGKSARDLLRDKNVAVVLVQAAIPPAAPAGKTFDAYVRAINATSLEGGRLWRTDLFIQSGEPGTIGGLRGRRLATAGGPVFINPFADPAVDADGVFRRAGRVLGGGRVVEPLKLELALDEESHARARRIVEAINTRFPEEPGQRTKTAMGRSGQSIALNIPPSFTEEPAEFINIVRNMQVDYTAPSAYAKRYAEALREQPWMAYELSYCLEAIGGDPAVRFLRELYDEPDQVPRLAALRAGARLGDHQSAEHLLDLATRGAGAERLDAIALLAGVRGGPNIDIGLRRLLESRELLVRVAAYESLARRAQGVAVRRAVAGLRSDASDSLDQPSHLDVLLRGAIPPGNLQGVSREVIGDKFHLDVVPVGDPLIYITQQGQPKIVLFGNDLKMNTPMLASAWSDRLMISADSESSKHSLYYRDYRSGRTYRQDVEADLPGLIRFLARRPTPEDPTPGLNLSYSEIVGVLFSLHQQRGVDCAFATETDKLRAEILEAAKSPIGRVRPETPKEREEMLLFQQPDGPRTPAEADQRAVTPAESPKPRVVPIVRPGAGTTPPKP